MQLNDLFLVSSLSSTHMSFYNRSSTRDETEGDEHNYKRAYSNIPNHWTNGQKCYMHAWPTKAYSVAAAALLSHYSYTTRLIESCQKNLTRGNLPFPTESFEF